MNKTVPILGLVVVVISGGAWYYKSGVADTATAAPTTGGAKPGGGRGGGGVPLTVDVATVNRHDLVDAITVVGNLIGEATVDVSPRAGGRVETIFVKLGDRVTKGQAIAKMEDRDVREQVNQAESSLDVGKATVSQRESDMRVAKTTLDRMESSFAHGLISKQNLEDAQARHNSSVAAVSVAKAQAAQTQGRIDELKITLSNTNIVSPVDGFVGKRSLDAGAFAGTNTAIVSVVDIGTVRLVANLVEKDFRRVVAGVPAAVEVDAFPGETFAGRVGRVAPVFDPATRTASMEIEIPNSGFRLKPGMYARVKVTAERRPQVLVVPRNAIVDIEGKRGVYVIDQDKAHFKPISTGLSDAERVEVLEGLSEGQRVITVGALALREGDRVAVSSPAVKGGKS